MVPRLTAHRARAQILVRLALGMAGIATHYWLVPVSYSWKPLLPLVLLALLTVARSRAPRALPSPGPLSFWTLSAFVFLHAVLLAAAFHFAPLIAGTQHTQGLWPSIVAIGKLFLLLPTFVLFAGSRKFLQEMSAELAAVAIALFTFDPERFFTLVWPYYSTVVGHVITFVARPFVPGTHLTSATEGALVVGPNVDMLLGVSCSGIKSIVLFQVVFTFILIAEWNHINRSGALFFYSIACAALLLANTIRLTVVYLTLNLTDNAINLSWPLFLLTFLVLSWFARERLAGPPLTAGSAVYHRPTP